LYHEFIHRSFPHIHMMWLYLWISSRLAIGGFVWIMWI